MDNEKWFVLLEMCPFCILQVLFAILSRDREFYSIFVNSKVHIETCVSMWT